ncbi:MAG TPA: hypothetical protein VGK93_02240 [Candidatus Eisenbacteria bacterium]|jgi:hypothetical protein
MRDDAGRSLWAWWVVVAGLSVTAPASAQKLYGAAEVNYNSVDRVGPAAPLESWVKTFRVNYAERLRGDIDLSSQFQFSEQTIVGRPDRLRNPQGSLRLAHRYWGVSSAYQPSETRDARSLTTRQQSLSLTGYAQKPGLPNLAGSWIRNHVDPTQQSLESATITRGLSSVYTLPNLGLRAAYGDRFSELPVDPRPRMVENHLNLGATTQFQVGRAPVGLRYDFGQTRANPTSIREQRSRVHTAGANSSYPFSPRTSSTLSYTYRRTDNSSGGALLEDHNGALSLGHTLSRAVQVSAGGGVRSVTFAGRDQTESFVAGSASAQGEARAGWRMAAAASRSYNWLPGISARPVDSFQSSTTMRLARGLDARGDLTLSAARAPDGADTTNAVRRRALQAGAGVTANPLRTVYLDAAIHRSRAGEFFLRGGVAATSYTANLRLTPSPRLSLSGAWGLNRGSGSTGTTAQASAQWVLGSSFQASGAYTRARQEMSGPGASPPVQESYSGSVAMALGWDLRAAVRYSESNPGQASEVRLLSASMSRNFGR